MRENLLSFELISKNNNLVSNNGICKIFCNIKRNIAIAKLSNDNAYEMNGFVANKESMFILAIIMIQKRLKNKNDVNT